MSDLPPTERPATLPVVAICAATLFVAAACWMWAHATPALGERPFTHARIGAARCAAAALWALGHAVLFGIAIPMLYRSRPIYLGVAGVCGLAATLCAIGAGALFAAG